MEFSLAPIGISVGTLHKNLSPAALYEHSILYDDHRGSLIADTGALIAYSGAKTGRSPKDKHIVRDAQSMNIWWGKVNAPVENDAFLDTKKKALDYLNQKERLYCFDGFAGWDSSYKIKIRVVCSRPYHALFMHTMLIRPTEDELSHFGEPDFTIINAGECEADSTSKTAIDLSFEHKTMVILGTEYAGEMKKGVFTIMNYLMPKAQVLSMHCSATADTHSDRTCLMFGLSGTGKTTLSADPHRLLIGDDEHCWSDNGVFNIEGGCYAKAIDLQSEKEPEIFQALRFGAVLENVVVDLNSRHVDYKDSKITENTRGAYPIEYISNAKIPCVSGHPSNIIFLTCDAFGILPPVCRLTTAQAMYHFLSGYTAKVAGTEIGIKEPQATFSPCFGGPFLVWHPARYAGLLGKKLEEHKATVWLVNTGWSGGSFGTGERIPLKFTRAIINAINSGALLKGPTQTEPIFGLEMITACPEVPDALLIAKDTWKDGTAYERTSKHLATLFIENFKQFSAECSAEISAAGPQYVQQ